MDNDCREIGDDKTRLTATNIDLLLCWLTLRNINFCSLSAVVPADITLLSIRIYFVLWFFQSASVARLTVIKFQHSSKPFNVGAATAQKLIETNNGLMKLSVKYIIPVFILLPIGWLIYDWLREPKESDKVFHAGPAQSGLGGIYFALYNDGRYQFCDGDFIDPGCYTGKYSLSGDTILLHDLREHDGIPTNRFIIRRYKDRDSSYWRWKNSGSPGGQYSLYEPDTIPSATGDIFVLDQAGNIVRNKNHYWVIRLPAYQDIYVA